MTKKYIDAESLIALMNDYLDIPHLNVDFDNGIRKAIQMLQAMPAADVEEVRHGEWIDDSDDVYWGNYIVKKHCSECGYTPKFDRETGLFNLTKRCPECGAIMDGKEIEDDDEESEDEDE